MTTTGTAAAGHRVDATMIWTGYAAATPLTLYLLCRLHLRLSLSRAKHPMRGHCNIARFIARRIPFYEYDEAHFLSRPRRPPTRIEANI